MRHSQSPSRAECDRANDVLERADRLDNAVSNLQAYRALSPTIGWARAQHWTAHAALRPSKGPWENYRHETVVPLVSPIARRTFLD